MSEVLKEILIKYKFADITENDLQKIITNVEFAKIPKNEQEVMLESAIIKILKNRIDNNDYNFIINYINQYINLSSDISHNTPQFNKIGLLFKKLSIEPTIELIEYIIDKSPNIKSFLIDIEKSMIMRFKATLFLHLQTIRF